MELNDDSFDCLSNRVCLNSDDVKKIESMIMKVEPHLPYSALVFEDGNYYARRALLTKATKEDLMTSGTAEAYAQLRERFQMTGDDLFRLIQAWPQQTAIFLLLEKPLDVNYSQLALHAILCRASIEITAGIMGLIQEDIDRDLFLGTVFQSVRNFRELLDYAESISFNCKLQFFSNVENNIQRYYYKAKTLGFSTESAMMLMMERYLEAFGIIVRK